MRRDETTLLAPVRGATRLTRNPCALITHSARSTTPFFISRATTDGRIEGTGPASWAAFTRRGRFSFARIMALLSTTFTLSRQRWCSIFEPGSYALALPQLRKARANSILLHLDS